MSSIFFKNSWRLSVGQLFVVSVVCLGLMTFVVKRCNKSVWGSSQNHKCLLACHGPVLIWGKCSCLCVFRKAKGCKQLERRKGETGKEVHLFCFQNYYFRIPNYRQHINTQQFSFIKGGILNQHKHIIASK